MKRTKTHVFSVRKNFIRDDISVSGSASADEASETGSLSSGFIVEDEGSFSSPINHGAQRMESEIQQDFHSGGSSPSRSMTPQEEEDSAEGGSEEHPPPRTSTLYKGRAAVDKVHNVPFLFVSNKTSNQVYHKYFEANPECAGTLGGEGGRLLEVVIPPGMKMWEAFILDDPDRDHAAPQDE